MIDNDPEELSLPERDLIECAYCSEMFADDDPSIVESHDIMFCSQDCAEAYADDIGFNDD